MNKEMKKAALKAICGYLKELKNVPEEEFKRELTNFKTGLDHLNKEMDKKIRPKLLDNPNFENLITICEDFLDESEKIGINPEAVYECVFEEVMYALYGEGNGVIDWLNNNYKNI